MSGRPAEGEVAPRLRIAAIQYLRAVAALNVVLLHATREAGLPLWWFGSTGVDIFFVLSGFLMVAITDDRSRPGPFVVDRLLRIVPLYWLATAAWLLLRLLLGGPAPDARYVVASLLFLPFERPDAEWHFFPVLDVGWTLNYEVLFYLLFALCLLAPGRWRLPLLTVILLALVAMGRAVTPGDAPLAFWTNPIILEFLAGAWIAAMWRGRVPRHPVLGWALIAAAPALVLIVNALTSHFGLAFVDWRAAWMLPAGAVLVGALLIGGGRSNDRSYARRFALLLGDASYSLYLFHRPALLVTGIVADRLGLSAWSSFALLVVAAVTTGVAAHLLVERPLLDLLRRRRVRRGWPVPAGV